MEIFSESNNSSPPFTQIDTDWFGQTINPPVFFRFELSRSALTFSAKRSHPAESHPDACSGAFLAELWKFDVAEFFLTDPVTNHYLEFNLSPNGAHWCAEFSAPLKLVREHDVEAISSQGDPLSNRWSASAVIELDWLREQFHFGPNSRLNASFILDSPNQRFLTATHLGEGDPDFHRPHAYSAISII